MQSEEKYSPRHLKQDSKAGKLTEMVYKAGAMAGAMKIQGVS